MLLAELNADVPKVGVADGRVLEKQSLLHKSAVIMSNCGEEEQI